MPAAPGADTVRKRGRTVGAIFFALLIGVPTAEWSRQIITQAFSPPPTGVAPESCRAGVEVLLTSVREARERAAAEVAGERASVSKYRGFLATAWASRGAIGAACRGDPQAQRLLHELDLLRYAEERTVRQEAVDVARRRRRVRALARDLGLSDPLALEKPSSGD